MKKLITLLFIALTLPSLAQENGRWERIKALKVSFFTEQLELSPEEAQKFWPVYNAFDKTLEKIRKQERLITVKERMQNNSMTKAEAQAAIADYQILLKEKYEAEIELITKLSKVLAPQKVIQLPKMERRFREHLFEEWKRKRPGKG
ncbi:MAG: hypothetical protein WBG71_11385 [Leeuwenhoekiella sp.]